jgi:hypothetical protein
MYRALGAQRFVTYFALAVGLVAAALWIHQQPANLMSFWRLLSSAVSGVGIAGVLVGQTSVFPWLCRWTPLRHVFPDIDGEWHAELNSNWQQISVRTGATAALPLVTGTVQIKARLFTVKLRYTSISPDGEYLTSQTRSVDVMRDAEDGLIRLFYLYEAEAGNPVATDSSHHYGAAYLDLVDVGPETARLRGLYWTNRNWSQGLNTAGSIELIRRG